MSGVAPIFTNASSKTRPDKFDRVIAPTMWLDRHKCVLNIALHTARTAREKLEKMIENESINQIPEGFDLEDQLDKCHRATTEANAVLDKFMAALDRWEAISASAKAGAIKKRTEIADALAQTFPQIQAKLTEMELNLTLRTNRVEQENQQLRTENLGLKSTASAANTTPPSEVTAKLEEFLNIWNVKQTPKEIADATMRLTQFNSKLLEQLHQSAEKLGEKEASLGQLMELKNGIEERVKELSQSVDEAGKRQDEMACKLDERDTQVNVLQTQLDEALHKLDDLTRTHAACGERV